MSGRFTEEGTLEPALNNRPGQGTVKGAAGKRNSKGEGSEYTAQEQKESWWGQGIRNAGGSEVWPGKQSPDHRRPCTPQ